MARCDQGYRCAVCGGDVADITESDLYLRYVLGEVAPDQLHRLPEQHIRCHPALAQFIVDDAFPPVEASGPFAKRDLDPEFARAEEARVTAAWRRLQELPRSGVSVLEYPLPERSKVEPRTDVPRPPGQEGSSLS